MDDVQDMKEGIFRYKILTNQEKNNISSNNFFKEFGYKNFDTRKIKFVKTVFKEMRKWRQDRLLKLFKMSENKY